MDSSFKNGNKSDMFLEGEAANFVSRVHIGEMNNDSSADDVVGASDNRERRFRKLKVNAMEIDFQTPKKRKSRKNKMEWDKRGSENEIDADDELSDIESAEKAEARWISNPKPFIVRAPSQTYVPFYLRLRIDEFLTNNSRELKLSCGSGYNDILRYVEQKSTQVKVVQNGKSIILHK
uniref:Uncharacterized protein n=1 Tax=Panagrolaimus sp. JU765 TaxID=591449 RepID=A0AC34QUH3_9BILA